MSATLDAIKNGGITRALFAGNGEACKQPLMHPQQIHTVSR